jgi:hypothetical protein
LILKSKKKPQKPHLKSLVIDAARSDKVTPSIMVFIGTAAFPIS